MKDENGRDIKLGLEEARRINGYRLLCKIRSCSMW